MMNVIGRRRIATVWITPGMGSDARSSPARSRRPAMMGSRGRLRRAPRRLWPRGNTAGKIELPRKAASETDWANPFSSWPGSAARSIQALVGLIWPNSPAPASFSASLRCLAPALSISLVDFRVALPRALSTASALAWS